MSLCLTCISRTLDCVPRSFTNACAIIERTLPSHIHPVGGSILLQLLTTATYEEIQKWAHREAQREKAGQIYLSLSLSLFSTCAIFLL